jgi:hypothetical protein
MNAALATYRGEVAAQKNRRLECSRPPAALDSGTCSLEHAKHDGADKGECDIRGNNAQSADQSHGKPPWFTSLPAVTSKLANRSNRRKSALLSLATPALANVVKKS